MATYRTNSAALTAKKSGPKHDAMFSEYAHGGFPASLHPPIPNQQWLVHSVVKEYHHRVRIINPACKIAQTGNQTISKAEPKKKGLCRGSLKLWPSKGPMLGEAVGGGGAAEVLRLDLIM